MAAADGYTGVSWPEIGLQCRLWYRSQQPRGATTSDLHSYRKLSHGGGQEPASLGGAGNMGTTADLCRGASCPRKRRTNGKTRHVGREGSRTTPQVSLSQMECAVWKTGKIKWTWDKVQVGTGGEDALKSLKSSPTSGLCLCLPGSRKGTAAAVTTAKPALLFSHHPLQAYICPSQMSKGISCS